MRLALSRDDARVIEVDSTSKLVWAYVRADICWAHTERRLANGNTLIIVTDSNRVIEVDSGRNVVWSYTNLQGGHDGKAAGKLTSSVMRLELKVEPGKRPVESSLVPLSTRIQSRRCLHADNVVQQPH